jgi:hypothetical protein
VAEPVPPKPAWPAIALAAAGVALAATRWLWQGSFNVYTDAAKRFYAPDPVVQWRLIEAGPAWLGLDALGVVGILFGVVLGAAWWARRSAQRAVMVAAWLAAVLTWFPGAWAWRSGVPPEGSVESRPADVIEVPEGIDGGLEGVPAGLYRGAPAADSVVAVVDAGGERLDARFSIVEANVVGDPSDLRQPLRGTVVLDPRTIDTGVDGRSRHAQNYLEVEDHPTIRLDLSALRAAQAEPDGSATFVAAAELALMGETIPVEVRGRLRREGSGDLAAFTVDASFAVRLSETPLQTHATDFASDSIPIRVRLPFRRTP